MRSAVSHSLGCLVSRHWWRGRHGGRARGAVLRASGVLVSLPCPGGVGRRPRIGNVRKRKRVHCDAQHTKAVLCHVDPALRLHRLFIHRHAGLPSLPAVRGDATPPDPGAEPPACRAVQRHAAGKRLPLVALARVHKPCAERGYLSVARRGCLRHVADPHVDPTPDQVHRPRALTRPGHVVLLAALEGLRGSWDVNDVLRLALVAQGER